MRSNDAVRRKVELLKTPLLGFLHQAGVSVLFLLIKGEMVLSNKKLKQKLRAETAESLTSAAEPNPSDSSKTNQDSNPQQPQSLKQLLNSVSQKPRFSKREKKRCRTQDSLQDSETVESNNIAGNDENEKKKKKLEEQRDKVVVEKEEGGNEKKRKRNGDDGEERKNLDLVGDDGENGDKKKKRKKKEKREEGEEEEESGDVKKANKLKKKKKRQKKQKKKKKENKIEEENKGNGGPVANVESNETSESQANGNVATKVYVGGIPYNASENDIKTYFEGCGTINDIDYMTFPDSGKFRGIAIINFRTEGAAKRALALDGSEMDGLFLKIQSYKTTKANNKTSDFAPKIVEGYNRIYVGNLSWDIREDDLKKLFSDCKISSIRFGTDKETGEFRGYAHVDFSNSLSLTMALKLDQEIVCGRPVKISCAVPHKQGIQTKSTSSAY
ncbi:31 kDa ribonucleoprotein, chloroplastic [Melia azedarach]|uniref:31 kDa ribonucleoprotein, chloroplastic n=1 Tax=Melia azedarach TaxID=155640 RepID=A0ACC1Y7U1_MELAZ|nr:31 kDa ribonucleoprotein, chloroplastic [Melia azedarach]